MMLDLSVCSRCSTTDYGASCRLHDFPVKLQLIAPLHPSQPARQCYAIRVQCAHELLLQLHLMWTSVSRFPRLCRGGRLQHLLPFKLSSSLGPLTFPDNHQTQPDVTKAQPQRESGADSKTRQWPIRKNSVSSVSRLTGNSLCVANAKW